MLKQEKNTLKITDKIRNTGAAISALLNLESLPYLQYYKGNDVAAFAVKLLTTAHDLDMEVDWLPKIMFHESGLNPSAVNSSSGATGLIQFMPSTASGFFTTTDALANMSGTDQLDYVYLYYNSAIAQHGAPQSLADAYMLTFYPEALGKSSDYILGGAGTRYAANIAAENPGFDKDGKGYLTVQDVINHTNSW